jgi:two-component system nitrogen regulation response regulator NtrX
MPKSILIIDDEADIRDLLSDIFTDEGYITHKAAHSEQALSLIKSEQIDLIILDIWLENSDMDGVEILHHLKKTKYNDIPILMISGHGNVEMAVDAMKIGAFDFIEKPFKIDYILLTAERALEQKQLKAENQELKDRSPRQEIEHDYKSPIVLSLFKSIESNLDSDARVLITGETGTGKSKIARMIYETSLHSHDNLQTMHASMLTEHNIDQYLSKKNTTVILEQVEKLPPKMQNVLLQKLSHSEMARIISTATFDEESDFSVALYDRLSVIHYNTPSLSQRIEDIPVLAQEFLKKVAMELSIQTPTLSNDAIEILKKYDWKNNIHQLKIAIEWIVLKNLQNHKNSPTPLHILTTDMDILEQKNLSSDVIPIEQETIPQQNDIIASYLSMTLKEARDSFEKSYLTQLLNQHEGNISQMAENIDMDRTALYRKLKTMNITYSDSLQDNKVNTA